jgi:hypothetical protein
LPTGTLYGAGFGVYGLIQLPGVDMELDDDDELD